MLCPGAICCSLDHTCGSIVIQKPSTPRDSRAPTLADVYRLAQQLKDDSQRSHSELQRRDQQLYLDGEQPSLSLLLFWLDRLNTDMRHHPALLSWVGFTVAAFLGAATMAGLLLTNPQGIANAPLILFWFVFIPALLTGFSLLSLVRARSRRGGTALYHCIPKRWWGSGYVGIEQFLPQTTPLLSIRLIVWAQGWGMAFAISGLAAFFAVLAINDIGFVWGTTFTYSDDAIAAVCRLLSLPWSSWLDNATVTETMITNSRYHPSLATHAELNLSTLRAWWPFLAMSILVYGMGSRLLGWLVSNIVYRQFLKNTLLHWPGAQRTLHRLRQPVIETQTSSQPESRLTPSDEPAPNARRSLTSKQTVFNWNDAITDEQWPYYGDQLALAADQPFTDLGRDWVKDQQTIQALANSSTDHLTILVKGWEPPMAELRELIQPLNTLPSATLALVPLGSTAIAPRKVADWRQFATQLSPIHVDVLALSPAESI